MTTLVDHLVTLYQRIQTLERRGAGSQRYGAVSEVDYGNRLMRVRIGGTDDKPFLSPWVPWSETAAGPNGVNVAWNPKPGQNVMLTAPGGDLRQAVAIPFTWSDEHGSPSAAGDETVVTFGQTKVKVTSSTVETTIGDTSFTQTPTGFVFAVGGVFMTFTAAGLSVQGGMVKHNVRNIGDTHIHAGVEPGGATTSVPAN